VPGPKPAVPATIAQATEALAHVTILRDVTVTNFVAGSSAVVKRFPFTIPPNTPVKDLLPVPPGPTTKGNPLTSEKLEQVPAVEFQESLTREMAPDEAMKQTAHMIARINHLNGKKTDGFLEALRHSRGDLDGLPFAMGDACRTKGERSRQFAIEVGMVRAALQRQNGMAVAFADFNLQPVAEPVPAAVPPPTAATTPAQPVPLGSGVPPAPPSVGFSSPVSPSPPPAPAKDSSAVEGFWERYQTACTQEDKKLTPVDKCRQETVTVARIAALMQVLAAEPPSLRLGLVRYLSTVSHVEATRAMARLAVFANEDEVRQAAVDALKVRRERDYTDILLAGLRYPWPAVARHAADALIKLERTDLVPQLVSFLDEPDPRAPVLQEVNDKKAPVVRELVRINHHKNCLLCHAPGNTGSVAPDTLTAEVPLPSQPLPSPGEGYRNTSPDLIVRIDVTYLRQDFSAYLPVQDANPWPEMQRFDFLTRTRVLTKDEAAAYRQALGKHEPGRPSPYHRAVLAALRELTGRDAEPTAAGWRRLLGLPTGQPRAS
jgi:hypothetical protein